MTGGAWGPAEILVASPRLSSPEAQAAALRFPALYPALAGNGSLHPGPWSYLYARVERLDAMKLVARPLPRPLLCEVLEQEERLDVLRTLLRDNDLSRFEVEALLPRLPPGDVSLFVLDLLEASCLPFTLERLAELDGPSRLRLLALSSQEECDDDLALEHLSSAPSWLPDPDSSIVADAAHLLAARPALLGLCASSPHPALRRAAAQHLVPLPASAYRALAGLDVAGALSDEQEVLWRSLAYNPVVPVEVLAEMLDRLEGSPASSLSAAVSARLAERRSSGTLGLDALLGRSLRALSSLVRDLSVGSELPPLLRREDFGSSHLAQVVSALVGGGVVLRDGSTLHRLLLERDPSLSSVLEVGVSGRSFPPRRLPDLDPDLDAGTLMVPSLWPGRSADAAAAWLVTHVGCDVDLWEVLLGLATGFEGSLVELLEVSEIVRSS